MVGFWCYVGRSERGSCASLFLNLPIPVTLHVTQPEIKVRDGNTDSDAGYISQVNWPKCVIICYEIQKNIQN